VKKLFFEPLCFILGNLVSGIRPILLIFPLFNAFGLPDEGGEEPEIKQPLSLFIGHWREFNLLTGDG
jgi:hypothetical protein